MMTAVRKRGAMSMNDLRYPHPVVLLLAILYRQYIVYITSTSFVDHKKTAHTRTSMVTACAGRRVI